MRALLYDVHGNLPALEAVLADLGDADVFVLGGDSALAGAWPKETVERLKELPNATWIRGNVDRWLVDRRDAPTPATDTADKAVEALGDELVQELFALPETATIDGTLYCHASPLTDMQSFLPEPAGEDAELLLGVEVRRVVFGHTHIQFARTGPGEIELVNPGSVGMGRRPPRRLRGDGRRRGRSQARRVRLAGVGRGDQRARRRAARAARRAGPIRRGPMLGCRRCA